MSERNGKNGNGRNGHSKTPNPIDVSVATRKDVFIQELQRNGGLVSPALKKAKLARSVAYEHLSEDATFREAWLASTEIANDELFKEARKRALVGETTYTIVDGKRHRLTKKSDLLLIFLMNNHEKRLKWRQRIKETGNAALSAVREAASEAGMTEDQVQQVQNKILEKFKSISLA